MVVPCSSQRHLLKCFVVSDRSLGNHTVLTSRIHVGQKFQSEWEQCSPDDVQAENGRMEQARLTSGIGPMVERLVWCIQHPMMLMKQAANKVAAADHECNRRCKQCSQTKTALNDAMMLLLRSVDCQGRCCCGCCRFAADAPAAAAAVAAPAAAVAAAARPAPPAFAVHHVNVSVLFVVDSNTIVVVATVIIVIVVVAVVVVVVVEVVVVVVVEVVDVVVVAVVIVVVRVDNTKFSIHIYS